MTDKHPSTPIALVSTLVRNRGLVRQLAWQEIAGRYRSSLLGVAWMAITPLLMLSVYTFVFAVVFQARWGTTGSGDKAQFAVVLFAGLAVFTVLSECLNRAPGLIVSNANYVKRVVFPLELLPVIVLCGAVFHFMVSMLVWLVAAWILIGPPPPTAFLLPVVILPLAFGTLGASWGLAALGVYLRDVGQVVGVVVTGLLFLSPIFYPIEAVPEGARELIMLNPVGYVVEMARGVLVFGRLPDLMGFLASLLSSILVAWAGFWLFQKTRKGFADVL
ncbi:ABC transporter permease [Stenotrophomonas sp. Marseille-Q4652]|uniref:ABC transporter permease n=1 Tax=Stenotrophomonas sp. Marseille-Q4652 TaxID=2866595 RepID=UPI001CE40FD7|nr:ABC transporter permease [Stenotrophomonas sp. Marseille-Q4652]